MIDLRWVHWSVPTIWWVLGRPRQADNEFKSSMGGSIVRPCHKNQAKQKTHNLYIALMPLMNLQQVPLVQPDYSVLSLPLLTEKSAGIGCQGTQGVKCVCIETLTCLLSELL